MSPTAIVQDLDRGRPIATNTGRVRCFGRGEQGLRPGTDRQADLLARSRASRASGRTSHVRGTVPRTWPQGTAAANAPTTSSFVCALRVSRAAADKGAWPLWRTARNRSGGRSGTGSRATRSPAATPRPSSTRTSASSRSRIAPRCEMRRPARAEWNLARRTNDAVTAPCETRGVRAPKLLCVASAIDLDFRYGCTPAWWQLWKGLHDEGVDLLVTPYRGRPVETPWWRTAPNPAYREGELFAALRVGAARLKGDTHLRRDEESPGESLSDRAARRLVESWVTPRWRRHLEGILERERDVDAVVVFTVPLNHLR